MRASIERQAQEGGDTSAELHKQVASRKRLAKMFVVRAPCLRTLLVHVCIKGASYPASAKGGIKGCNWKEATRASATSLLVILMTSTGDLLSPVSRETGWVHTCSTMSCLTVMLKLTEASEFGTLAPDQQRKG